MLEPPADPRRATLETFLVERRAELVAFVARRAPPWVSPDDLVQQAAQRALEHVDDLRDPGAVRAWVYTVLRRALVDASRLREEPRAEVPEVAAPAPEAAVCRCAVALIDDLRPEYGEVIRGADLRDEPVARLAHELGITPNNTSVRLHRARAALRSRLLDHCGVRSVADALRCACEHARCAGESPGPRRD